MIREQSIELFGQTYSIKQFSAIEGIELLNREDCPPEQMLGKTSISVENNSILLNNVNVINQYIYDRLYQKTPVEVLKALICTVQMYNFGFLESWQSIQKPYFLEDSEPVALQSKNLNPICSFLLQHHYATLIELETHYNVQDLFILYDALLEEQFNKCLIQRNQFQQTKRRTHDIIG